MDGYQRPPPFPYKEIKYNWYYRLFDRTVDRFNENTKVLVVDGPIAAGKSTFAKQLADELDMLYIPEADLDMKFINQYGEDYRKLNHRLPTKAQFFDVKDFSRNPKHPNTGAMQIQILALRFEQYIDGLAHLYNTGQGIVLDRSIYSDFVFMEAMFEAGYVSKDAKKYYDLSHEYMKYFIKAPHLVIYLDVPVPIVQQRIKERNRPWEVNSPALTDKYLSTMERVYKRQYLNNMSVKSEVIVYDWSNFGDVDVVVEDIEKLDFTVTTFDEKFSDWRVDLDREHSQWRVVFTNDKDELLERGFAGYYFPEMILNHEEEVALREAKLEELKGEKYEEGYNPQCGDQVLWKWK